MYHKLKGQLRTSVELLTCTEIFFKKFPCLLLAFQSGAAVVSIYYLEIYVQQILRKLSISLEKLSNNGRSLLTFARINVTTFI